MKKIISILLTAACILTVFCSCGKDYGNISTTDKFQIKTDIGSNECKHNFVLEVTNEDESISAFNIYTDENTVGEALDAYMLASFAANDKTGEDEITFKDFTLDKGNKWVLYVNGKRTSVSPTEVVIIDDAVYSFAQIPEKK